MRLKIVLFRVAQSAFTNHLLVGTVLQALLQTTAIRKNHIALEFSEWLENEAPDMHSRVRNRQDCAFNRRLSV